MIIVTGDEILQGKTLDYNSHWIAKRLTGLGIEVKRKITVPDEKEEILKAIRRGIARERDILLTIGGLGPTPRDTTLHAVADALGKELVLNTEALHMIRRSYERFHQLGFVDSPKINEARKKMAKLPTDAKPVKNELGGAPGVLTPYKDIQIVSLPGVPSEMMYTLEQAIPLLPTMREENEVIRTKEVFMKKRDESMMAQAFEKVMEKMRNLEIKSYPTGFGKKMNMRVIATAHAENAPKAEEKLDKAITLLKKFLQEDEHDG